MQTEKPEPYDLNVVGRYGVLGSTVFPSFLFYWYNDAAAPIYDLSGLVLLEVVLSLRYKWLDGRFVGTAIKTVLSKTVIDQAVSAPIILVTFYTGK